MARSATAQVANEDSIGGKLKLWPLRVKSFYTDVRMEMKKVTTPSFKEVRATTMVVIIAVGIFGVYFFVVDRVIGTGMTYLLNYFK